MTSRSRHPGIDEWKLYLELSPDDVRAKELRGHLKSCQGCAGLVDVLKTLRSKSGEGPWRTPDTELVRRASRLSRKLRPAPDVRSPLPLSWDAVDVRGAGPAAIDEGRIVARSCRGADLSIAVMPPGGDDLWVLEGRVWLREPAEHQIHLVLSQGDHVIRQERVADGEHFRFEELIGPRWTLEIHLPTGDTILLNDPFTPDSST